MVNVKNTSVGNIKNEVNDILRNHNITQVRVYINGDILARIYKPWLSNEYVTEYTDSNKVIQVSDLKEDVINLIMFAISYAKFFRYDLVYIDVVIETEDNEYYTFQLT